MADVNHDAYDHTGIPGIAPATAEGAEVTRAAAQTITTATTSAIAWDTEVRDDAAYWSSGSATRLTAPATDWYIVAFGIDWQDSSTGKRVMDIRANGSSYLYSTSEIPGSADTGPNMTISAPVHLAAGEYVECTVYQDSGGNRTVTGRGSILRWT